MKKIFISLLIMFGTISFAFSANMPDLKYKNIGIKNKITYDIESNTWSKANGKKGETFFVKTKGFGDFYDYLDSEQNFAFSTNCEYEFIHNSSLIGFSNRDMKFYEILYDNNTTGKRALSREEVEAILPDYKVVSLSEFSTKTGALKIKKNMSALKIFLFNDTGRSFDNYTFSSGNSKFEQYDLRGFITVYKPGMIQFSKADETDSKNWYVLLVR